MNENQLLKDSIDNTYGVKKYTQETVLKYIKSWISSSQYGYMLRCGNFLDFVSDVERNKHKLVFANFCKNRFCPICNFRNSMRNAMMLQTVLKAIKYDFNYSFYFITLTVPNVSGERLNDEIGLLNDSVKKLFKRAEIKRISKGYIRKLEVTYNKHDKSFNPHIHLIIAVNKSYSASKLYLSKSKWLKLWRSVTNKKGIDEIGRDEISQISVQPLRNSEQDIFEITKYAAKDFDLIYSQEVFDVFYNSFKGKNLLTFNSIFKTYVKKYKNDELDDFILKDKTEYFWFVHSIFNFENKKYKREYTELTDDQRRKFKLNAEIVK